MKKTHLVIGLAVLLAVAIGAGYALRDKPASQNISTNTPSPTSTSQQVSSTGFNKQQHSLTESGSLWVIASKKRPLAKGYAPESLVTPKVLLRLSGSDEQMKVSSVMAPSLEALFAAAKNDGVTLRLSSAYRSEALQTQFYSSYVARDGQEAADKYSARPGTSEHQTGLAADIIPANDACHLQVCFGDMAEGKWLAAHAHEHGFIIRYLDGKESITTYQYEPWHLRYVGNELASELHKNGLTMEEFFNHY
jgi:D-alanyl-D-alanine carboxypeptidase